MTRGMFERIKVRLLAYKEICQKLVDGRQKHMISVQLDV